MLCHPSWTRISAALAAEGVQVSAEALTAAEPFAKRDLDRGTVVNTTNDARRAWLYFDKVLEYAGVAPCAAIDCALALMHDYHGSHNLWEYVPDNARPTLAALRKMVSSSWSCPMPTVDSIICSLRQHRSAERR